MRVMRIFLSVGGLVLLLGSFALGADIYITQNASGGDTGTDCANAHSAAWFNANATGGNTYHLCGTCTGTAGSTMLTPPNSGSAGSVVTILFETDAVLTAPYWGGANAGAISVSSKGYITIDGGSNGIIQNSANGTALTYQQASQGIYVTGSNHIEIRNLTIQNIYVNEGSSPSATDTGGLTTADIRLVGNNNNISIHNNALNNARSGVRVDFDSATLDTISIHSNSISDHCWGIMMGSGSAGTPAATDVTIHDNTITGWLNWQCPANASFCTNKTDAYHTDGMILYTYGSSTFEPLIYNNFIHGDLGRGSPTAYIFCTYGSTPPGATCTIFNNLLVNDGDHGLTLIWTGGSGVNHRIYNNTIVGYSGSSGTLLMLSSGSGIVLENNIIMNGGKAIGSYGSLPDVIATSDYNIFYNINNGNPASMFYDEDGGNFYSWSQWQGLGFDPHSSLNNPQLDSSYKISSASSPAYQGATNLSSLGVPELNVDRAGLPRPTSGAWDMGAYQFQFVSGTRPDPPTNLRVTSVK